MELWCHRESHLTQVSNPNRIYHAICTGGCRHLLENQIQAAVSEFYQESVYTGFLNVTDLMGHSRLVYSNYLSQLFFYISQSGLAHLPTNGRNADRYSTKKFYEVCSSLQTAKINLK